MPNYALHTRVRNSSPLRILLHFILLCSLLAYGGCKRVGAQKGGRKNSHGLPMSPGHVRHSEMRDRHLAAKIVKNSHFSQTYKLGYKILLLCEAEGTPMPMVVWYKDGAELVKYKNVHVDEAIINKTRIKSKVEIDPGTIGDQGIYVCLASNRNGYDLKSFRMEYYY